MSGAKFLVGAEMVAFNKQARELNAGLQQKQLGLYHVEASNKALVGLARAIAREQCVKYGSTTIDAVRQDPRMAEHKPTSSAAWGSVFHCEGFVCIGFEPSQVKENHSRFIRRWRFQGE